MYYFTKTILDTTNLLDDYLNQTTKYFKRTYRINHPLNVKRNNDQNRFVNMVLNECLNTPNDENSWQTFKIPKHSGGFRTIITPEDTLKGLQRQINRLLVDILKVKTSENAYAYTKKRTHLSAVQAHQKNESNWFLKIDFKDFFTSLNETFVRKSLKELTPLYPLLSEDEIDIIVDKCIYKGFIPQGAPTSPIISNLVLTAFDVELEIALKKMSGKKVFTRYADDLIISDKYEFDYKEVVKVIENVIKKLDAPLKLNSKKTRYGSRSGRNWNLGLMLNQDNKITLGYKNKERYRASLYNLFKAYTENTLNKDDCYHITGVISYCISIEPDYFNKLINNYEHKFNIKYKQIIKDTL